METANHYVLSRPTPSRIVRYNIANRKLVNMFSSEITLFPGSFMLVLAHVAEFHNFLSSNHEFWIAKVSSQLNITLPFC